MKYLVVPILKLLPFIKFRSILRRYLWQHRKASDMENVKLARQDWETAHIDSIAKQEKKTSKAKLLFDLYQVQDKKPVQARALKKILDDEYKLYCMEFDLKESKKKASSGYTQLLNISKQEKNKQQAKTRKQRAHELITIGALTEVTGFEKDRGLIAGVLLEALERFKNDDTLMKQLKDKGDTLLHSIEIQKKKVK